MPLTTLRRLIVLLTSMLVFVGCSSKPTQPAAPATQFHGNVTGPLGLGTIDVSVATPSPQSSGGAVVSAAGTVRVSSGPESHPLSGIYNTSAHELVLAAPGWSLVGTLTNGILSGTFTVAGGSGVFIAQEQGAGADVITTFCSSDGPSCVVNAGLAVRGTSVTGVMLKAGDPNTIVTLVGTFSPADSSLVLRNMAGPVDPPVGTGRLRRNSYVAWTEVRFVFAPYDTCDWSGQSCQ